MKDREGNNKALYTQLGASNHARDDREENDYYATHPSAATVLLGSHTVNGPIRECACGEGHLSKVFKQEGYEVYSSDLVDRGYGVVQNFADTTKEAWADRVNSIITNPPYKYAKDFLEHSMSITNPGTEIIMFLKLQFLEGQDRKKMFAKYPPKKILVSSSRISCAKNGDFDKYPSSAIAYAWYIWENGYTGDTKIEWVN